MLNYRAQYSQRADQDPLSMHTPRLCPLFQNHLGLVQPWFLNLLNSGGQKVVSSIIRQRDGGLHHPGAVLLKDPITHYTSYTGSHKWTFGSIMLIVFRPVLQDVTCMVSQWHWSLTVPMIFLLMLTGTIISSPGVSFCDKCLVFRLHFGRPLYDQEQT